MDFKVVVRAMGVLGIKEKDQDSLWKVLAAILLLGMLYFCLSKIFGPILTINN